MQNRARVCAIVAVGSGAMAVASCFSGSSGSGGAAFDASADAVEFDTTTPPDATPEAETPEAGQDAAADASVADASNDTSMPVSQDAAIDAPPEASTVADASDASDGSAACGPGTVLASGETQPIAVAADATYVYWLSINDVTTASGALKRAPLAGVPDGGAPTVLAQGLPNPYSLVIDATNAYWTNTGSASAYANGSVMQLPLLGSPDGGSPTLITGPASQLPAGIALANGRIFWDEYGLAPYTSGLLRSAPIGGGSTTTIAAAPAAGLPVAFLAVDATRVYWSAAGTPGRILASPLGGSPDGGAPEVIVPQVTAPYRIAVDAANVYFTAGNFVYAAPVTGITDGGAPQVLANDLDFGDDIAVDGSFVYVSDEGTAASSYTDGRVIRIPTSGAPYTVLACGQGQPSGLRVVGANVYWTDSADGTVRTIAK